MANKKITPNLSSTGNVQIEDIRDMLFDALPADYPGLGTDTNYFSDNEIIDAMRRCQETFNEQPPISVKCSQVYLATHFKSLFKVGVCWQAFRTKYLFFIRQAVTYTAGETSVNVYAEQAKSAKMIADEFKQEFLSQVPAIKANMNSNRCWGVIG